MNAILGKLFGLLFLPFTALHPWYGMVWISLLSGLLILIIYKHTSNQPGIRRVKDKLKAHFFELRLFKDDFRLTMIAQKDLLLTNLHYLGYAVKPLLFLILPVVLIIVHTSVRYEYRPLLPGEPIILSVTFKDQASFLQNSTSLEVPEGIVVETPPLHISDSKQMEWRLRAEEPGNFDVTVTSPDAQYTKTLYVSTTLVPVQSRRLKAKVANALLYPGEPPLPEASPLAAIELKYPRRRLQFLGIGVHWLVAYFVLSILFAFVFKRPFRVEV